MGNLYLWKLKRWLKWWSFADGEYQRERRRQFVALTGLHAVWINGRYLSDMEVIAIQARKIKGLEMQLTQQSRGMQRKVSRLERRLIALSSEVRSISPNEVSAGNAPRDTLNTKTRD